MPSITNAALIGLVAAISANAWKDQCEGFKANIPNVVMKSTYYPAGALVNLTSPSSAVNTNTMPAFCRKYYRVQYYAYLTFTYEIFFGVM
jgi:hypothetical protein